MDGTGIVEQRLKDFSFMDLYTGDQIPPMVRGLHCAGEASLRAMGAVRLPDTLAGDVEAMMAAVRDQARRLRSREFSIEYDGINYRCAIVASPIDLEVLATTGEIDRFIDQAGWCIRRVGSIVPDLKTLDLPQILKKSVVDVRSQNGLVIVGGSTGSGKTTTASAILREWALESGESAVTLEDPPEFPMAGAFDGGGLIQQVEVTHTTLVHGLRYARRWNPRYLMIGEVRTPEAAAELLHISISGPMVICTVHAADIVQCIASIVRFATAIMNESEARRMLASSLRLVVHQKMTASGIEVETGRIYGDGAFVIRSRIETGAFGSLQEEFDRQKINMRKARL